MLWPSRVTPPQCQAFDQGDAALRQALEVVGLDGRAVAVARHIPGDRPEARGRQRFHLGREGQVAAADAVQHEHRRPAAQHGERRQGHATTLPASTTATPSSSTVQLRSGRSKWPAAVAARDFVRAGAVEKVAGEGAQFGAVEIALVVERHAVPARRGIQPIADVADGIGFAIAPGRDVAAHEIGVDALALDGRDVVVLDAQGDGALDVALEGEVDVAFGQHQGAVDTVGGGKRQGQAAGPMGHGARSRGVAPVAAAGGAVQRDVEVGAGRRRNPHAARRAQPLDVLLDQRLELVIGLQPGQRLGMLVADVDHAGSAAQDGRQFRRVHQPFDGAVHHQRARGQGGHDGSHLLQRGASAGGSHGRPGAFEQRGHLDGKGLAAHPCGRQPGQLNQHGAALAFAEHGHRVAGAQRAADEHGFKGIDPGGLQDFLQHGISVSVHTT